MGFSSEVVSSGDAALVELAGRTVRRWGRHKGLVVGVLQAGRRATVGAGQTEDGGVQVDSETSFQIGSITKVFTALVLADAVVGQQLALDQRLDTLIPGAANHPDGPPITLEDLAMHTAGLSRLPPGLWRQALRNRDDPYAGFTTDDLVAALRRPPRRRAGDRSRYSNYGAGVLGEALQRGLHQSFGQLVADRIAQPLGMDRTATHRPQDTSNIAEGHNRRGRRVPDWQLSALAGAGALRSTTTDLLRFLTAHLEPRASPMPEAIELCTTTRRQVRGPLQIALGWHVLERRHRPPVWWHNGGTGGFFSYVAFVPESSTSVSVLTNTARSVDRLGMNLLGELEEQE